MRIALLLPLLLAACATQPQAPAVLTTGTAQQMNAMQLCAGTLYFRPENAQTAREEAQRRGLDCAPLYPVIQAEEASRRAAAVQMIQNQPQYRPYQLPMPQQTPQTTCTSQRLGNQVQTVCR